MSTADWKKVQKITWSIFDLCVLLVFVVLLTACETVPVPSKEGKPVMTPQQCEQVIARGGRC
jgi:hypothetical protein